MLNLKVLKSLCLELVDRQGLCSLDWPMQKPNRYEVWNRTPSRAHSLVEEIKPVFPNCMIENIHSDDLNDLDCDLLVNTTSAGMQEQESPFNLNHANRIGHVADIIYNPPKTPLLKQAEQLGIPNHNGLGTVSYTHLTLPTT